MPGDCSDGREVVDVVNGGDFSFLEFQTACYNTAMEAILENLVRSPKFPRYVDELNEIRQRENVARNRFRETLDEDVRAEFINGEVITQMSSRDRHALTVAYIGQLVSLLVRLRRLGAVRTEQALAEFTRNDYVPDIGFWSMEKSTYFVGETTIYPIWDL
jgi:hypothetical protein